MKKYLFILLLAVGCSKDEERVFKLDVLGENIDVNKFEVKKNLTTDYKIFTLELFDSLKNPSYVVVKDGDLKPLIILKPQKINGTTYMRTVDTLIGQIFISENKITTTATSKKGSKLELKNY